MEPTKPKRKQKRGSRLTEGYVGSYTAFPHAIIDSVAYRDLSDAAKALLTLVMRQHNGKNNGHMQLAAGWLKSHGWTSDSKTARAKEALLKSNLVCRTRRGGLNAGPDRYALTWLPITNFSGLDVDRATYRQGAWALQEPLPAIEKHKTHSLAGSGAAPSAGLVSNVAAPSEGAKTGISDTSAAPSEGDNETVTSSLPELKGSPLAAVFKLSTANVHRQVTP